MNLEARTLRVVREAFRRGLMPPEPVTVSEWADKHRVMSALGSSEPGRYRTDRTPYMREIMDSLSVLSPVKRVVFMKPSRIGGSEAGNNWLGYVIDNAPGPFMLVCPREQSAKSYVDQKINPLIEATPKVREHQRVGRGPDSRFSKVFDGCVFTVANAKSAASLRALDARFLMCDEVDAYPSDVDSEGDPLDIALKRTATFGARAKQYIVSTPLVKGTSRIEAYYKEGDQREYQLPCPHCDHMQALAWSNLQWPKDQPRKAVYVCQECGGVIEDHHKTDMLARGQWVPTAEGDGETRSYKISSLYTPNGWEPSFADLAQSWVNAQGKNSKLKVFTNQNLAETWEVRGEAPDWERLYDRREDYAIGSVPGGVFLTAGVDVQADRIEVYVWSWGKGKESWLVEYRVLPGDPYRAETFAPLTTMLGETWGEQGLPLARLAIDSGYATDAVIGWARSTGDSRVMVIKGDHHMNWSAVIGMPKQSDRLINGRKTGIMVWPVGGALIKEETYGYFRLPTPIDGDAYKPGFIHLPKVDDEVCKQLTAEDLITTKNRQGFPRREWVKNRDRNEALDCRVYARAAAEQLGMSRWSDDDWNRVQAESGSRTDKPKAKSKRGGYLSTPRQRIRGR